MENKETLVIIVEGGLDLLEAKTAIGVIKYNKNYDIIALIDSNNTGKKLKDIIEIDSNIPIVDTIQTAITLASESKKSIKWLLLGTAPKGGILPAPWLDIIINAINSKINIMNPLHHMFNDDIIFKDLAIKNNIIIWDVRKKISLNRVADTSAHNISANVILTVGTDCNVGKMTTAIEIDNWLKLHNFNSTFVPTGQTGILIEGWGIAIDDVISDFTAGAAEELVLTAAAKMSNENDFIIVEGQGSLCHPGYSGVTLSLLHGSAPDALILCHQCSRKNIRRYDLKIPSLLDYIELHNLLTKNIKSAPIICISLNTVGLNDEEAKIEIENIKNLTGLPVTDPVRFGTLPLTEAIINFFS